MTEVSAWELNIEYTRCWPEPPGDQGEQLTLLLAALDAYQKLEKNKSVTRAN